MTQQLVNNEEVISEDEEIISELDISHLVTEDDTPVDNIQSEKQQRLLVEPLYSSKALSAPFLATANVGLFYQLRGDPIVPDAMLSLGVQCPEDFTQKKNRSYFVWEFGKVPEVCIEVVSNAEGDEIVLSRKSQQKGKTLSKKEIYTRIRVPYYVVFDPLQRIQGETEMNGALLRVWSISADGYTELTPAEGIRQVEHSVWLNGVGIGLTLWEGQFEDEADRVWLRWCDRHGNVIPTGAERAEEAQSRAEEAQSRAEEAQSRAEDAEAKAQRLAERLRSLGIDPNEI